MPRPKIREPKRKRISNQIPAFLLMSLVILFITFFIVAQFRNATAFGGGGGKYLYNPAPNDKETKADIYPIVEYVSPPQRPSETNDDYHERKSHPSFLGKDDKSDRVVLFYAPWCGHCVHYKPVYIKLGREVNAIHPVTFHAVSCVEHGPICKDEEVHGYPAMKYFGPGVEKGEVMDKKNLSGRSLLKKYLKLKDSDMPITAADNNDTAVEKKVAPKETMKEIFDKNNMFSDASASFDYALRNSIFLTNNALTEAEQSTLKSWLGLIEKTMPQPMKSGHDHASSLLHDFDNVVQSEENILKNIEPKQNDEWSHGCSKGKDGAGYTCGLWSLFHVMTIGFVEWNVGSHDRISSESVSEILRDYIEHFFTCDECRRNFLEMYDKGRFNREERLTTDASGETIEDWKQLSLWLWEVHNDVNVRLLQEDFNVKKFKPPSIVQEQNARWPHSTECPKCWLDGGGWDENQVFLFLIFHYWPKEELLTKPKEELTTIDAKRLAVKTVRKDEELSKLRPIEGRQNDTISIFYGVALSSLVVVLIVIISRRKSRAKHQRQKSS